MTPVSLVDFGSYLPDFAVGTEYYAGPDAEVSDSLMFRAPKSRRLVSAEETGAQMAVKAARPMLDRLAAQGETGIDMVLTNVALPDRIFTGAGAEIVHRLDLDPVPEWIIDVHNGGCAAFVYLMKIAQHVIASGGARNALLIAVQNSAGQLFVQPSVRHKSHAPVPGDGCGVGFLRAGDESPILDVVTYHGVENAEDMNLSCATRKYWEPGEDEIDVGFTDSKVAKIIARGNKLVPQVAIELCDRLGTPTRDIDVLVTNQPNKMFLRNWREALQVKPERHLNTYEDYGNLFGAGIPVTLDHAVRDGSVHKGDLIVMAGFAHAGDFAAAAAVRW